MTDIFLAQRGQFLSDAGFVSDGALPERVDGGGLVFYHYTRPESVAAVLSEGLRASRMLRCPHPPDDLAGRYLVEGFLVPFPSWLTGCLTFGDLGLRLTREYIGDTLLRVAIADASQCYVADYAHKMEIRHYQETGDRVLKRAYDLSGPGDIRQAYVNSFVPIREYDGGHVAPVVQVLHDTEGVAVPASALEVCVDQPIQKWQNKPTGGDVQ
jgi:hypothetical protein